MVKILFPVSSTPGPATRPVEGQGRLVNAYAEGVDKQITFRRVPGLTGFADPGINGDPRGFLLVGSTLYYAVGDKVVSVTDAGVCTTLVGTLPGSGPVTMARNNKLPTPDICIVADSTAFIISAGALASYPDADVGSPTTVGSIDGYFVWSYGNGQVRASDLNATTVAALSVTTAEAKPDGVSRITAANSILYALGTASIECQQNVGTSPYPFARSAVLTVGLLSPFAIAGFEDGWDRAQYFVASDGTVRALAGYSTEVVSTPDVERAIASVDPDELVAQVSTYSGRSVWTLSSNSWTWEFCVTTGAWNERASLGLDRWRGSMAVRAFDRWLIGDTETTRLLELDPDSAQEYFGELVWRVESARATPDALEHTAVRSAHFLFAAGVGDNAGSYPVQTNPRASISWSDDGGSTWSTPLQRELGAQGEFGREVRVDRCGRMNHIGRRWRLTCSDPVYLAFLGGTMEPG